MWLGRFKDACDARARRGGHPGPCADRHGAARHEFDDAEEATLRNLSAVLPVGPRVLSYAGRFCGQTLRNAHLFAPRPKPFMCLHGSRYSDSDDCVNIYRSRDTDIGTD